MNNLAIQQKIFSDKTLKLKYEILNKLGEGCFGSIYRAINLAQKRQVALKVQHIKQGLGNRINLANQIFILEKLKFIQGVPHIYQSNKWSYGVFMEIQLLSSSLHDERHKSFTEPEIYKMATELLQILKKIHSKNVIHQDLKPQNIMRNSDGQLVIIDFGLSAFLSDDKQYTRKRGFIGTPRYASCAAHRGEVQKPKDDIQSLLYVLGYIYTKRAPWFELKGPISSKLNKILKIKETCSEQWMKKCGNAFATSFQYIKSLSSREQVNYTYLINLFQAHRRSYVVKTLKFQNPHPNKSRRKSGNDAQNYYMQVPIIKLHLIERKKTKEQKQQKYLVNYQEKGQQINNSSNNYSQLAQDGYIEIIHALTDKLLKSFQLEPSQIQSEDQIQINTRQPQIFNISKLEELHFKNPFRN